MCALSRSSVGLRCAGHSAVFARRGDVLLQHHSAQMRNRVARQFSTETSDKVTTLFSANRMLSANPGPMAGPVSMVTGMALLAVFGYWWVTDYYDLKPSELPRFIREVREIRDGAESKRIYDVALQIGALTRVNEELAKLNRADFSEHVKQATLYYQNKNKIGENEEIQRQNEALTKKNAALADDAKRNAEKSSALEIKNAERTKELDKLKGAFTKQTAELQTTVKERETQAATIKAQTQELGKKEKAYLELTAKQKDTEENLQATQRDLQQQKQREASKSDGVKEAFQQCVTNPPLFDVNCLATVAMFIYGGRKGVSLNSNDIGNLERIIPTLLKSSLNTEVESIDFQGKTVNEGVLESIWSSMSNNVHIKSLHLRGAGVRPNSFHLIIDMLSKNKSLEFLDIGWNWLTDKELDMLYAALQINSKVKVDVKDHTFSPAKVQAVKKRLAEEGGMKGRIIFD